MAEGTSSSEQEISVSTSSAGRILNPSESDSIRLSTEVDSGSPSERESRSIEAERAVLKKGAELSQSPELLLQTLRESSIQSINPIQPSPNVVGGETVAPGQGGNTDLSVAVKQIPGSPQEEKFSKENSESKKEDYSRYGITEKELAALSEQDKNMVEEVRRTGKYKWKGEEYQCVEENDNGVHTFRLIIPGAANIKFFWKPGGEGAEYFPIVNLQEFKFPENLNSTELEGEVERLLRVMERRGIVEEDFVNRILAALETYHSPNLVGRAPIGAAPGVPRAPLGATHLEYEEINALRMEVTSRMYLVDAEGSIFIGNYEGFEKALGSLDEARINYLWTEWEDHAALQAVVGIMEAPAPAAPGGAPGERGEYFRNPGGILASNIQAELDRQFGADNDRKERTLKIAERLLKATGMASYYTGPMENGRLIAEGIMKTVDARMPARRTGRERYYRGNAGEQYFTLWRERRRGQIPAFAPVINPVTGRAEQIEDPAGRFRRVLFVPEDVGGRAVSLKYATESYVLTLVHANGHRNFSDYANNLGTGGDRLKTEEWGKVVKGGGDIYIESIKFLDNPLLGDRIDPSKLSDHAKPMVEFGGKLASYLFRVGPQIRSFAEASLGVAVGDYVNGHSRDRNQEWPDWPNFGPATKATLIELLSGYMDRAHKERALGDAQATRPWQIGTQLKQQGPGAVTNFTLDSLRDFLSKLGIKFG